MAKAIIHAIGMIVAVDLRPYSIVENESFRELFNFFRFSLFICEICGSKHRVNSDFCENVAYQQESGTSVVVYVWYIFQHSWFSM